MNYKDNKKMVNKIEDISNILYRALELKTRKITLDELNEMAETLKTIKRDLKEEWAILEDTIVVSRESKAFIYETGITYDEAHEALTTIKNELNY